MFKATKTKLLKCKLHVFCLAPKVTGKPIQYFCFALPKTFLTAFFLLCLVIIHWLIFLLKYCLLLVFVDYSIKGKCSEWRRGGG